MHIIQDTKFLRACTMVFSATGGSGNAIGVANTQALEWSKEAAATSTPDHPDQAMRLSDLSSRFHARFQQLGALGDLEQAIQQCVSALEATPRNHPNEVGILYLLSGLFQTRFQCLGELDDLGQAIRHGERVVAVTPRDHPDRAQRLRRLAYSLQLRFSQTPSDQHISLTDSGKETQSCPNMYLEAFQCYSSPPRERIYAARQGAGIFASALRWKDASFLLENAINILSKATPRMLGRDDQEHMLSDFTQLAALTVSTTLQAGEDPEGEVPDKIASHCLRLLELGRGIIMGLVIDCRGDLSELEAEHPDVFDRFNLLRVEIDSPLVKTHVQGEVGMYEEFHESTDQHRRRRRMQAIREIDETLAHIRQLPGFERFQLPPAPEDLMAIAGEGPIVIFNCTEFRSDAIIVTSCGIKALKLPRLVFSPKRIVG